jgi:hypothetical protein
VSEMERPAVQPPGRTIAQRLFDGSFAEGEIEDSLKIGYESIGWDYYDASLEIHGVAPECRLDESTLKAIRDAGFAKVYVNHTDKWETHYTFKSDGTVTPWRVSYPHKRGDSGKIWVEEIPPGWPADANVEVIAIDATQNAVNEAPK